MGVQSVGAFSLHYLSLIRCSIDHSGVLALVSVISHMPLGCFVFQLNPVGDDDVAAIVRALPLSIEYIALDATGAQCGAFEAMAARIPSLPNLHTLFMSMNLLGAKGSAALANAIAGSALRTLNLSYCNLE